MISERVKDEDCNAGAIFDCLESPYWPSLKFALECLCEAISISNIQLILFQIFKDPKFDQAPVEQPPSEEKKQPGKPDPKGAKPKPPSKEELLRQ